MQLTPFPRMTVGKISLLYWRQMKKAPLAVIRPTRATVRPRRGRSEGMAPPLRLQRPEQMNRARRVQRLPALAMMKGTDQQGISLKAPRK